jgi:hypothetical protein
MTGQAEKSGCDKFGLTARAIGGAEKTVAHTLSAIQLPQQQLQKPQKGLEQKTR